MSTTTTEMTEKVEQVKVASGFAKRNANKQRIEEEEAELAELLKAREESPETTEEQQQADDDPEPESAEEKTFKKRYGDLRRHSQKKEGELQQQIDELRTQLEASTKKEIQYPKSESELEAWMEQYPDVAQIVETIAMKKAHEQASEFETKFKAIDEMKLEAQREKAEAELMRLHPDFEQIRDTDDFHNWVEEQPKWVQDALYDNDSDAKSAARAIDLYKSDMGITNKKKSSKDKEAAKAIGTRSERSAPEGDETKSYIKESDVAKMSAVQYEKAAEEIAEAIRTGKFVYDLSGSAR
jgi:DNA repair exonuclease SbcCD ATPase subunit